MLSVSCVANFENVCGEIPLAFFMPMADYQSPQHAFLSDLLDGDLFVVTAGRIGLLKRFPGAEDRRLEVSRAQGLGEGCEVLPRCTQDIVT